MGKGQEVARAVPRQVLHDLKRIRPMFGDGQRVPRQAVIEDQAAGLAARRGREARQGGQQMLAPLGPNPADDGDRDWGAIMLSWSDAALRAGPGRGCAASRHFLAPSRRFRIAGQLA